MLKKIKTDYKLKGTKAETLKKLERIGYNVPNVYFFSVNEWNSNPEKVIAKIINKFNGLKLAVRSSTKAEDTEDSSMAGAFESQLNVVCQSELIKEAVVDVISS